MNDRVTLEQRRRLSFLAGITDQERQSGRLLTADEFKGALERYPQLRPRRTPRRPGRPAR
jgi:hypothetical protein